MSQQNSIASRGNYDSILQIIKRILTCIKELQKIIGEYFLLGISISSL